MSLQGNVTTCTDIEINPNEALPTPTTTSEFWILESDNWPPPPPHRIPEPNPVCPFGDNFDLDYLDAIFDRLFEVNGMPIPPRSPSPPQKTDGSVPGRKPSGSVDGHGQRSGGPTQWSNGTQQKERESHSGYSDGHGQPGGGPTQWSNGTQQRERESHSGYSTQGRNSQPHPAHLNEMDFPPLPSSGASAAVTTAQRSGEGRVSAPMGAQHRQGRRQRTGPGGKNTSETSTSNPFPIPHPFGKRPTGWKNGSGF